MKIAIPAVSRQLHKKLFEKMTRAKEISNKSKYNTVEDFGGNMIIVTSGAGYNYTREAIDDLDLKCTLIKVGMSNPIPDGIIGYEVADFNDAIVIEELEPYLEEGLGRDIGSDHQIVYGKGDYGLERYHEYTQDIVTGALAEIFGLEQPELPEVPAPPKPRPPQFCKGCPHRATYDLIKKHAPDDCIYVSDIGCYTMAHELPYAMADINLCMGASIGLASGFAEATDQSILAFIGDSTFFHAGLPAIVNAAKHDNNFTLVILDNSTTAMTGHQPHAGLDLNIEDVVRALGVTEVITIDPRQPQDQIKEIIEHEGLSVIISKSPCILKVKP